MTPRSGNVPSSIGELPQPRSLVQLQGDAATYRREPREANEGETTAARRGRIGPWPTRLVSGPNGARVVASHPDHTARGRRGSNDDPRSENGDEGKHGRRQREHQPFHGGHRPTSTVSGSQRMRFG